MIMGMASGIVFALAVLGSGNPAQLPPGSSVEGSGLSRDCWQATKDGESAIRFERICTSALDLERLTPNDRAATLVNRGIMKLRRKSYDAAITDFNLAFRYRPQFAEALVNRGAADIGAHRFAEGRADITKALAMGVQRPEKALYNRGLAYEGLDDLAAASSDYERALEFAPSWPLLKARLAYISGARSGPRPKDLEPQT